MITKIIDRDAAMAAVSRILKAHRCRDWYCEDDESNMQLLDVLSQHSQDGTVARAMEECDDLAADIVDVLINLSIPRVVEHDGWYCESSPNKKCQYSIDLDSCDYCGQPEERQ